MSDAERILAEAMAKSNGLELRGLGAKTLGAGVYIAAYLARTLGLSRWHWLSICRKAWRVSKGGKVA